MSYKISGVQVTVWSAADIERQAALDLTESGIKTNLTLFSDGRFGTIDNRNMCFECRQSAEFCSGHWGMIRLGCAIPNPFFINEIKKILQCFCFKCSTLLYDKDRIELNNMHKLFGEDRISSICKILKDSKGAYSCNKCGTPVNEIFIKNDKDFCVRYDKKKEIQLNYNDIYNMFKNITNADFKTLGFNENLLQDRKYLDKTTFTHSMMEHRHQLRPEDFFITILPVLPHCIRLCLLQGKEIRYDGATILYQFILKATKDIKDAKSEKMIENARDTIQRHIFALFKQKSDDSNKKTYNSMLNRLSGKEGHFRAAVESKRANYGGRTVVGNAPYLPFGSVEIPQEMAKISQIEYVMSANLEYWNKQLKDDKFLYEKAESNYKRLRDQPKQPIYISYKPFIFYEPVIQYVIRNGKKTSFKFIQTIQIGDIIHRKLKSGDMAIINRQPTIRKENLNGHRLSICPNPNKRTICMPLPNCQCYNMDFDGDEGNIHVPQGPLCQAEMMTQMNIETKIMSDQTSTNVINLVQGVVYGLYLMTHDAYTVPFYLFCDYAFIIKNKRRDWNNVWNRALKYFPNMTKKAIPGKVIYSLLLPDYYNRKIGVKYEGDVLKEGVIIKDGILVQGQLTKKTMNKVIEDLYIEFSHEHAIDYINGANFLCNKFNTIRGFTFSLSDCLNKCGQDIKKTLKDTYSQVSYIETMPITDKEKETLIREALDKATQIGQKISKDGMVGGEMNAMAIATRSEAKGSFVNLSYISCFLGLQTVMGKRYSAELCEGQRILPCFKFGENSPKARGFIENNFYKGLDPIELFFHAWSSRKGLIDTAVTTKTSGYTHRKFGKKMENSKIDSLGCIRDCDGSIIDFCYGEYGFDPAEVYWIDGVIFFSNINEMIERINSEFIDKGGNITTTKFRFSEKQFEYLKNQLVMPGSNTEPVKAMKDRIMFVIKKSKAQLYLDKWCILEFMTRCRLAFNRSRCQPGNMVGFKATCAIGSVSTQDALNAFHSSGTSSKATTTGLPRLEELVNLTSTPKITGGSFRYDDPILNSNVDKKEKMRRVEDLRHIFEYKTFKDFVDIEILKTTGYSITNEWEDLLEIHPIFDEPDWFQTWFDIMEIERPDFDDGFIIKCQISKEMQYKYKMSLHDIASKFKNVFVIPSPPSLGLIYIFPCYDDVVLKNINEKEDSWKYYWTRDVFIPEILDTQMCGIYNIEKIFYSHENVIDYQGHNFKEIIKVPNVIYSSVHTDVIWEVVENLGIDAAYIFLYDELSKCLSKQLNPSHIMLLARTMTNEGQLTNVSRYGINKKVGVLTKASFETPVDNFVDAAIWGDNDGTNSLASSYFLGVYGNYGTRHESFQLIDKNGKKY